MSYSKFYNDVFNGLVITIGLRNPCNYNCFYCIGSGRKQELECFDLEHLKSFYNNIDAKVIATAFECGTGEPTLHPQLK